MILFPLLTKGGKIGRALEGPSTGTRRAYLEQGPEGSLTHKSAWRTLFAVMPVTVLHDRHESHRPEEKYKAPKRVRKRGDAQLSSPLRGKEKYKAPKRVWKRGDAQLRTPLRGNVCVSTSDAQNSLRVREAPCKNLFVPDKPEYERIPVTTEVSKQTIFNCPLCLQPNKALKVQFNRTYQLCLVKGCPSGPGCMLSGTERVICEHVLTFCSTRGVCFCLQNCSSKYHGEAFCGQCTQLHSVGCLKAAPLGTENSDREQDRD
jgi:hypothetical protein